MYRVVQSPEFPELLDQLVEWFVAQWGEIDPLVREDRPNPLLAIGENNELVGGLAFTLANAPDSANASIWINAVFVSPGCRGAGVASQLISAAVEHARLERGVDRLFVLTDIPQLYEKLGWICLQVHGTDVVLSTTTKAA